jgi:hypothetical protein
MASAFAPRALIQSSSGQSSPPEVSRSFDRQFLPYGKFLRTIPNFYPAPNMGRSVFGWVGKIMKDVQRAHEVARHIEELAQDSVLPDYVRKLVKAARDLEQWAAELEKEQPGAGSNSYS